MNGSEGNAPRYILTLSFFFFFDVYGFGPILHLLLVVLFCSEGVSDQFVLVGLSVDK